MAYVERFFGAFGLYELLMLRLVNRAILKGKEFPNWVWASNSILETTLPAFAVAYEAVVAFSEGTQQQDDLTAVVIKRT